MVKEVGQEWLGEEAAAEWLDVPVAAIREAVAAGELPTLKVGGYVRISRSAVLARAGAALPVGQPSTKAIDGPVDDHLGAPDGLVWLKELTPGKAFTHGWPQKGGGLYKEPYPDVREGSVSLLGMDHHVQVGRSSGAERSDKRARVTVFVDNYPVTEFVASPDGTKLASLIKPDGKKTVAPGATLPRLYRQARTGSYRAVIGMGGSGRSTGLALVIEPADYRSAVHHAAARMLGRAGKPIEPIVD